MRGLKRNGGELDKDSLSHLLQMRGLKHSKIRSYLLVQVSHLLQMRGLKRTYSLSGLW